MGADCNRVAVKLSVNLSGLKGLYFAVYQLQVHYAILSLFSLLFVKKVFKPAVSISVSVLSVGAAIMQGLSPYHKSLLQALS